ncbi:MAG: hypothetical protein ABI324_21615 [Ktedonobacteraceae bacterium]
MRMTENVTHERPRQQKDHTQVIFSAALVVFGPLSLVALVTFFVFMFTHWKDYVALTGSIISWVLFFFGAGVVIFLAWCASKALQALFDAFVSLGHGSAGVYRAFSEARGQTIRNKVIERGDNWVAIESSKGKIEIVPVVEHQYRYNMKVSEPPKAADVPALPSPAPTILTGRELLLNGQVAEALSQGKIILGTDENGSLKGLRIKKCFSMIVSGIPSVGKSTTVFWIAGQLTLIGAKLWIVDPHLYFEDEDGNTSLGRELADLSDSFVFPPCDCDDPRNVITRMQFMYQELRRRQRPGYIVRAEETIIGIMDEFNSVIDSIDLKLCIVKHQGQGLTFVETLALIEREGRKFGLHFMLLGHKWAKQDIGDNSVRTNATTYLCHKMNDEGQGRLLLGQSQGKNVLTLAVGSYYITGSSWTEEPMVIHTPMVSAADLPLLVAMKNRQIIPVLKQENVIESTVSDPIAVAVSDPIAVEDEFGDSVEQPGKHADTATAISLSDAQKVKLRTVIDLDLQEKGQNEIIRAAWGCEPNTRQGQIAAEELRQIRAYLAEQHTRMMRYG